MVYYVWQTKSFLCAFVPLCLCGSLLFWAFCDSRPNGLSLSHKSLIPSQDFNTLSLEQLCSRFCPRRCTGQAPRLASNSQSMETKYRPAWSLLIVMLEGSEASGRLQRIFSGSLLLAMNSWPYTESGPCQPHTLPWVCLILGIWPCQPRSSWKHLADPSVFVAGSHWKH